MSYKNEHAYELAKKYYHDINDIKSVDDKKGCENLTKEIQKLLSKSKMNDHDKLTVMKNITLRSTYICTLGFIEMQEKNQREQFEKDMK